MVNPWKPPVGNRCSVRNAQVHISILPVCPATLDISYHNKVQSILSKYTAMESKSAREYFQIFRGTPFTALLDDLMEIVIWRPLRSELARGGIVLHVSTWVGEEAKMDQ